MTLFLARDGDDVFSAPFFSWTFDLVASVIISPSFLILALVWP
jgi:hypothetical protein